MIPNVHRRSVFFSPCWLFVFSAPGDFSKSATSVMPILHSAVLNRVWKQRTTRDGDDGNSWMEGQSLIVKLCGLEIVIPSYATVDIYISAD